MNNSSLEIYTLGQFIVKKNSKKLITGNKKISKKWKLFQFLFTYSGRSVSREKLIRILNLEKNDDPQGALTALIYRLRKEIKNNNDNTSYIKTHGNAYIFNEKSNYWMDTEKFKKLCKKTKNLISLNDNSAIDTFHKAINLYKGDYLEETRTEEWVWSSRSYYRELLIETMHRIDNFLNSKNLYEDLWRLYEEILELVKFEEELILGSIKTLINSGNQGLARIKYEEAANLFRENDLKIPPELSKMGRKLNKIKIKNPSKILEETLTREEMKGAFVCNPETFTLIYDLEKRRSQRKSPPIMLVHLQIVNEKKFEQNSDNRKKLMEVLNSQLRCGDVVCRWSKNHYVLILVDIEKKDIEKVLDRIEKHFANCCTNNDYIKIKYRFYQI